MITTDTGAKILEGTDNWRSIFPDGQDAGAHNESVLAHDACIEGLQDALGIVVDGDQAAVGASTGQYIILKNSTITGCTDGLYTATKAIPANTSIDNTYLSAVSGGGLNALNTQITTGLNGKVNKVSSRTFGFNYTAGSNLPTWCYVPHPMGIKPSFVSVLYVMAAGAYSTTATVYEIGDQFTRIDLARADVGVNHRICLVYTYSTPV